jgi:hypothetical protein
MKADMSGFRINMTDGLGAIRLRESFEAQGNGQFYSTYASIPRDIDAINDDPADFKYQSDKLTLGAEGPVIKLTL